MKQHLLIVEDEVLILLSLSMILKSEVTEVTTASNGRNGLLEISKTPDFDLYIIDLTLPDMTGLELIQTIKKQQPQANIIVMTGRYLNKQTMLKKMKGAKELEDCHFLCKPFDINQVKETVFQILHST